MTCIQQLSKVYNIYIVHCLDFLHNADKPPIVDTSPAKRGRNLHRSESPPMTTLEFLNVRETAKELGVHENTVRNMVERGQLQAVRLPGSGFKRFLKEDVAKMREEMFSSYAPDTPMPEQRKAKRQQALDSSDY